MKNQKKILSLLALAISFNLISCGEAKKEDPALDGIWYGKSEKINPLTNEETVEIVAYEFRGEAVTTHYMKQVNADFTSENQIQTETGTYKKVEDSLEINLTQSSCAVYSELDNQTVFNRSKTRKIFYKLAADLKTLTIRDLTNDVVLTKKEEVAEDSLANDVEQAAQGCFVRDSSRNLIFTENPLTTIGRTDPRSGDPLN